MSLTERQISLADRLSRCEDSFLDAWLALHDYAAALGIRTINFWIVADPYSLIDDSTCAMWSSLPEENLRLYREMGGMTTDPCGLHIVRATAPLIVDPELVRASFDGMPAPVRRTATALIESHLNRMLSVNHRDPVTGAATGEELTRTTALFWDHVQRAKLLAEAPGLSRRQREALVLLARGYSLTQLAEELRVSVRAAEKLAAAARSKLGARTNAQAVYRAMVYRALA
jgi:DNA-binding CsgD family transcriptional regulator